MRKSLVVCAALFILSLTASAQDFGGASDASSSESEADMPASLFRANRLPWQIGMGFQYAHFSVLGQHFSNLGYQADVTRYFSDAIGVEGTAMAGFGHTAPGQDAKSFFIGGGPHVSLYNASRYETWVHALVGLERLRFTQTGTLGSNSGFGFVFGGGFDYKIGEGRLHWRSQADFIGADIGSKISPNFAIGTGLIFNF